MTTAHGKRNGRLALTLLGLAFGMIGLSFASVPLYQLFCQVTGYGGTTQIAAEAPAQVGERVITVRFNADVQPGLNWAFQPVERAVEVRVGENRLAFYRARNYGKAPSTGISTFNVTPHKAGPYFSKIACFCFEEQTLAAGEEVDMGVSFYVDPAINEDPNLANVKTITLSYSFTTALGEAEQLSSIKAPEADAEEIN